MIVVFKHPESDDWDSNLIGFKETAKFLQDVVDRMPGFDTRADCVASLEVMVHLRDCADAFTRTLGLQLYGPSYPKTEDRE